MVSPSTRAGHDLLPSHRCRDHALPPWYAALVPPTPTLPLIARSDTPMPRRHASQCLAFILVKVPDVWWVIDGAPTRCLVLIACTHRSSTWSIVPPSGRRIPKVSRRSAIQPVLSSARIYHYSHEQSNTHPHIPTHRNCSSAIHHHLLFIHLFPLSQLPGAPSSRHAYTKQVWSGRQ
ncbi:hypothetical protein C8F01DRAFT_1181001 [Mycena amicta]|nr:hypothetical protein C8F01DRAFT_1181001 [Mycena amicta]